MSRPRLQYPTTANRPYSSVSSQIKERFEKRDLFRKLVAAIYVVVMAIYLTWRTTIINEHSLLLSLAYYTAECLGFVLGLTIIFSGWRYHHRDPPAVPQDLDVDVFVLTYKEPFEVIRQTLMAARNIDYPHRTLVLDDGQRTEIREFAESIGITYLARGHNRDAKAGNLNFGLSHSTADFVAVFDADHIAQPHALDVMLGFLADEKVGMVQAPQDYYNVDAFQYMNPARRAGLWHDQSFFYNIAQPCADDHNAASCVGTCVIYRRSALDRIGGIPADTITEDIHTSLKLHKQGYKSVYVNEPVAYGVAAADLAEYYKTRHRWAHGNLAALKKERILTCTGLTPAQRMSYLTLGLIYLEGWQQLMLFAVPLLALVFGLAPFEITIFNVIVVLSFPILTYLLLQELGCGFTRYWTSEIFAMARWPVHLASAAALFGRKLSWKTSAKNIKGRVDWFLMLPQLTVLVLSVTAIIIAVWRLTEDFQVGPLGQAVGAIFTREIDLADIDMHAEMAEGYSIDLVAIASFWALFNASRAAYFIGKTLRNAKFSHTFYRFALRFPVILPDHENTVVRTEQVSESWVRLALPPELAAAVSGKTLQAGIVLPGLELPVQIDIARKGKDWLEGRLDWAEQADRDRLAATLYSVNWHREFQVNIAYFLTLSDLILALLGRRPARQPPANDWQPLLLQAGADRDGTTGLALAILPRETDRETQLIAFRTLSPGETCTARLIGANHTTPTGFRVVREVPITALPNKGLDGARYRRYKVLFIKEFGSERF